MKGRTRIRTGAATVIAVASIAVYPLLPMLTPSTDGGLVIYGAATVCFVLVGLLLVIRAPGNRIGPVLMLAGALLAVSRGCDAYAAAGSDADPDWPGSALASVVAQSLIVYPIVLALIGIPLIFPDGHLISRRWRFIAWLVVVAVAASTVSLLIPLAVPGFEAVADILGGFASATSIIGFGAAVAALWVRYRRGDQTRRQQLKWLLAVAALAGIFFAIAIVAPVPEITFLGWLLGSLTLGALPLAIAVAVLRYRLYDIDRIVSRGIAYGLLTAVLAATYAAVILLLQGPLGTVLGGDTLSVALSTLVVAALFQPLRRRFQRAVDRRFDRARVDADLTSAAFSERLRAEVDIGSVAADLDRTVRAALKPSEIGLWLRDAHRAIR